MSAAGSPDVTQLLHRAAAGDALASEELMSAVYGELHGLALAQMRNEYIGHTLQPTALVHEAFLKMIGERVTDWQSRSHFFGIVAQAMRRILLDHARSRSRAKRSGGVRVPLDPQLSAPSVDVLDLLAVDAALCKLEALDARQARVVEARFFCGLDVQETADMLGISTATVKRDWTFARAFLQRELDDGPRPDAESVDRK